jgi:hypothetical protein
MKFLFVAAALAAALVPLNAAHAVAPIHAYEFDVDASDSIGSADGTLLGGASISGGRLLLDGNNDYVAFTSHLVPTSGAYSVFIRVNGTPNLGGFTEIISQGFSSGTGFFIGTAAGGGMRFTDTILNPGVVFPSGEAELLLTSSASGTRFYIDGAEVFSSTIVAANGPGGTPTYFGRQFEPFGEFFRGSIDAIRIYGSVVLPSDVTEPVSGVPEPASWAMLIAGFGLTGAALRRRRTMAIAAR